MSNQDSQDELRDWYAYFLWNNVHLLRSLKVELTPVQQKLVEECSKRYAATVREDTQKAVTEAKYDELETLLINAYAVDERAIPLGVIRTRMAEYEAKLTTPNERKNGAADQGSSPS